MEFALEKTTGERIRPKHGTLAICQCCGDDLIPKCGRIKVHHWAHKVNQCDEWWESETEWHRNWKSKFPSEWRERVKFDAVSNEKHVADVLNPNLELYLEFQNSPISIQELESREMFYQRMIWVVNGLKFSIRTTPLNLCYEDIKSLEHHYNSKPINSAIIFPQEIVNLLYSHRDHLLLEKRWGSFQLELNDMMRLYEEQLEIIVDKYLEYSMPFGHGTSLTTVLENLIELIVVQAENEIRGLINHNNSLDEENQYVRYIWPKEKTIWNFATKDVFVDTGKELLWLRTKSIAKRVPKVKFIEKYSKC
jgi:hypothetical protein